MHVGCVMAGVAKLMNIPILFAQNVGQKAHEFVIGHLPTGHDFFLFKIIKQQ